MNGDDLCFQTATEVIAAFEARTLSPVELMDAIIDRCQRVNPAISAFTYTFFDRAREQARQAEKAYANGTARALEGVPCVIKDLHPVEGEITTWGSKVYEGVPADYTVPTVQRLFDAGIIMHGPLDHIGVRPHRARSQPAMGRDAQPVESRTESGRLFGRRRRVGLRGAHHHRRRHRRRRLGAHSRLGLRRVRLQAAVRPQSRQPARHQLGADPSLRPDHAKRGGRGADAERDERPARQRHHHAARQGGPARDVRELPGGQGRGLDGPRLLRGRRRGAQEHAGGPSTCSRTSSAAP